jgi:hypothetical protein
LSLQTLLERDYAADDDADEPMPAADGSPAPPKADSKLDKRVQNLVKLICDLKMMKDAMLEVRKEGGACVEMG